MLAATSRASCNMRRSSLVCGSAGRCAPHHRISLRRQPLSVWAMSLKPGTIEASVRPASPRTKDLASRIMMAPGVSRNSRAIVVGSGALPVIDVLKYLGVQDIVAVDPSMDTLSVVTTAHGKPSTIGNEPAVRTWQGDFVDLPAYMAPADVVVFTEETFGTAGTPRDAMVKASMSVRPGGCVIINSEEDSRRWLPKYPPTRENLCNLISGLPVQIHSEQETTYAYCGILQVPANYRLRAPLTFSGPVVRGFGRGSSKMGTPTANVDPAKLRKQLKGLPRGVYFGWAKVITPEGWPAEDGQVHKMVMNVGARPTVNSGGEAPTVEAHILHEFKGGPEFYGAHLQLVAVGFIRPEIRFDSVEALAARIKTDVALARVHLDTPALQAAAALLEDE